jgi:hypothetical protein
MEAKGVVIETTPNGDQVLMGEAANQESLASDPRGPVNAAAERPAALPPPGGDVPQLAAGARGRMARGRHLWQLQKADAAPRALGQRARSLHARPDGRGRTEEGHQALSAHPPGRSGRLRPDRQQALRRLAGLAQMPGEGIRIYEKYAAEYPDGPRTAQALYQAVYRQAVLTDMFAADGSDKKSDDAHNHARELAAKAERQVPASDFTVASRGAGVQIG